LTTVTADGGAASFAVSAIPTNIAATVSGVASFLFTGVDGGPPIQTGVDAGAISAARMGVIHGSVADASSKPFPGAVVTVLGHPEFGQTMTLSDGTFNLAVNGGGLLIVAVNAPGYLPVQRTIPKIPWNGYSLAGAVVLTRVDPVSTVVQFPAPAWPTMVRGTPQSDSSGSRTATLYVPHEASARIVPGNGVGAADAGTPVTSLTVHATEYTVGPNGPAAMPGDLPPSSGYTYAVEYSADEIPAGSHVEFSQPLYAYTVNQTFLNMKVGDHVPAGYYDRDRGQWVPSADGLVIKILGNQAGVTQIDLDGSGVAADRTALANAVGGPITDEELFQLITYSADTTLWRVPIPHFTPWDFNWPYGPAAGATAPPVPNPAPPGGGLGGGGVGGGGPAAPSCSETCCTSAVPGGGAELKNGSYIECYTGIVHEAIPIAGTPYRLTYSSDRVEGYGLANHLEVPLTGSTPVPSNVVGIEMEVDVAGTSLTHSFLLPASTNQIATFDWNGMDSFGRYLPGSQLATVSVGYTYPGVYLSAKPPSAAYDATFGHYSYYGTPATGNPTRQTVTLWSRAQVPIGPIGHWCAEGLGLGGWTLDAQHVYDPTARTLYLGDGTRQPGNEYGLTISTVVGNGKYGYSADGTAAANVQMNNPTRLGVLPDGSLLISDVGNCVIQKVSGGVISTVAGVPQKCAYNGDNQPATQATLSSPRGIAVAPDGSFYFADSEVGLIRHVGLDGMITSVAGVPSALPHHWTTYSGDGQPATGPGANLYPWDVFLAKDGSLYFSDETVVLGQNELFLRKVDSAGLLSTIQNASSDAMIAQSDDGIIYLANSAEVDMIDLAGKVTTFAARGSTTHGVPAVYLPLNEPSGLVVARDGTLYIADTGNDSIYAVGSNGVAATIAGTGARGYSGDQGPAINAQMRLDSGGLALSGDEQTLYVADDSNRVVRAIAVAQPGFTNANFIVAAASGDEVYEFGPQGQHLGTVSLPTNTPRVKLGYTNGLITSLTDADGNVTTIQRDPSGKQVTIVSPFGVPTTLYVGQDGYLANVVDPTAAQYNMRYSAGGLLARIEFPTSSGGQHVSSKSYDTLGRVVSTSDAAGHALSFDRQPDALSSVALTKTTSAGVTTNLSAQVNGNAASWTATNPDNTTAQLQRGADGSRTVTAADGTYSVSTFGPDPRFGMQAPLATKRTITMPGAAPDGGAVTETVASTRTVVLSNPGDPLSLVSQTDTVQVNSFKATTSTYYADGGVVVSTSPEGRTTVTYLNQPGQKGAGQPAETFTTGLSAGGAMQAPEVAPTWFQYNDAGLLVGTQQGTFPADGGIPRQWSKTYDPQGYVQSVTDPTDASTTYNNDLTGHALDTYLPGAPDGGVRDVKVVYDGDGNPQKVTLPNGNLHQFGYTPVDALSTYTPPLPAPSSTGTWSTQYLYDPDGHPSLETRADGAQIQYVRDTTTGKLMQVSFTQPTLQGTQTYGYSYYPSTGLLETLSAPSGETLTFGYGGSLTTGVTWSGPISGKLISGYDNALRIVSQGVNGNALAFGYDQDNLPTSAGAEIIGRDTQNGRVTGTTLGTLTDAYGYDGNGQLASYVARYNTTVLYSETINSRYADGRIKQRTETIADPTTGQTNTYVWNYGYDSAGRLGMATLTVGGVTKYVRQYGYDGNDNRTSFQDSSTGAAIVPTYDAQDRLASYDVTSYKYGMNGELQSKTGPGGAFTQYVYDVFGNLLSVTVAASGESIAYLVDGQNRRVGVKVNGALSTGYLYQDQLKVVAQLGASGILASRFVYGSKSNVPDYYTDLSGNTYRIISDHIGSPRLVVNTTNGSIVEEVQYDEFGNVLSDAVTPGAIPFGFAGGLRDPYSGFVRFGARDYDPYTGRWTSKDPTRFSGGMNLYGYVVNDPVNFTDPNGLLPNWNCVAYLADTCRKACSCHDEATATACFGTCLLTEVGAAIKDPTYCIEPRNTPRCQAQFAACTSECVDSTLTGSGDNTGALYSCLRTCMYNDNCSY
jgi:RHS repeat-associated protein